MVQPLLKYPDSRIRLISANVRFFNDELLQWITDMVDTMKANDLDALSAIMIGVQYNIIVIKKGDEYLPYINARLIKCSGKSTQTERSTYYEAISVDVERFDNVTVIYEDEKGEPHHQDLSGDPAHIFQQQLDYSFGSTFVDRVDREMKQRINDHLEFGLVANGSTCPMVFVRDYFKRGAKYVMLLIALSFIIPFFASEEVRALIYRIDIYLLLAVPVLMIAYFFYALYESRLYKQCTSCQIGNIIGTTAIMATQLLIVAFGVFFWVAP
ncbi:peptide deformylase [Sulfuricurvum sp.]|uniref:peptide deformylase n=1 Tax=Sulfuricurvum sp. TaxID=2025608 RepID=UPI0026317023|nr:peptide deformylase [Sulfuricurvum sp.]MDD2266870.1 peptide deformylase [Sulfuricurvum sp.]MDD2784479.1 peptide deformylase [Sulfuricurvum sp.]